MKLLLMSGGLDSAAIASWCKPHCCLTIDYGQRPARAELQAGQIVAERLGFRWDSLSINCAEVGSGDLLNTKPADVAPSSEWWPYRNQLLVTLGAAWGLPRGFSSILVGSVASDEFHADGTAAFYESIGSLVSMQEGQLEVTAPAISLDSRELVSRSGLPREVAAWTHSCHKGNLSCGTCRGCLKRKSVMDDLGWSGARQG